MALHKIWPMRQLRASSACAPACGSGPSGCGKARVTLVGEATLKISLFFFLLLSNEDNTLKASGRTDAVFPRPAHYGLTALALYGSSISFKNISPIFHRGSSSPLHLFTAPLSFSKISPPLPTDSPRVILSTHSRASSTLLSTLAQARTSHNHG